MKKDTPLNKFLTNLKSINPPHMIHDEEPVVEDISDVEIETTDTATSENIAVETPEVPETVEVSVE